MTMSKFSLWVFISLALHGGLLAVLALLRFASPSQSVERQITIQVLRAEMPKEVPPTPVIEKPQPPPPAMPMRAAAVRLKSGITKSLSKTNVVAPMVTPKQKPGRSAAVTAPPNVMTSPKGAWTAPPGKEGSTGTQGEDLGTSGPTYGATAKGGPTPGYPKLAEEERLSGTVVIRITVTADGNIADLVVSQSSGHDVLDDAARRAAQAWNFSPAMENGVASGGTIRLRFRFADGLVEGQAI